MCIMNELTRDVSRVCVYVYVCAKCVKVHVRLCTCDAACPFMRVSVCVCTLLQENMKANGRKEMLKPKWFTQSCR